MQFLKVVALLAAVATAAPSPAPEPATCAREIQESVAQSLAGYKRCTSDWVKRDGNDPSELAARGNCVRMITDSNTQLSEKAKRCAFKAKRDGNTLNPRLLCIKSITDAAEQGSQKYKRCTEDWVKRNGNDLDARANCVRAVEEATEEATEDYATCWIKRTTTD